MFSATEELGTRLNSWWIMRMPAAWASRGDAEVHRLAVEDDAPRIGTVAPESMRISVDLPAPFSPTTACTSPP